MTKAKMTKTKRMQTVPTILITGASRGLGLATAKLLFTNGYNVILGMRTLPNNVQKFLYLNGLVDISEDSHRCLVTKFDVRDVESIQFAYKQISKKVFCIKGIINNAGVLLDAKNASSSVNVSLIKNHQSALSSKDLYSKFIQSFDTNALGSLRVVQSFRPLLKRGSFVINISSLAGQLKIMESGIPSYRVSKAALNALTLIMADELKTKGIKCVSLSPGWIKTEMGGNKANLTTHEGAKNVLSLIEAMPSAISGRFYRNNKIISW